MLQFLRPRQLMTFMLVMVVFALAGQLMGCAAPLPGQKPPSPAQVAAQFCPIAQPILSQVAAMAPDPKVDAAQAILTAVCTAGAAVTTGNLQAVMGQVFPAIATALAQSSLIPTDQRAKIQQDLLLAQLLVQGALALNPPLTSIGTTVAAPAPAASAP